MRRERRAEPEKYQVLRTRMRLSPQGLRKNNVVGIAKAKEEFQERRRDRKVKCSRAQGGRELVNLGSLLSSIRRRI